MTDTPPSAEQIIGECLYQWETRRQDAGTSTLTWEIGGQVIEQALNAAGKIIVDKELSEEKRNEVGETISRMRHIATGGVIAIAVHAIITGQDTGS